MALRFVDSFDHYSTANASNKYTAVSSASIVTTAPRTGTQHLQLTSDSTYAYKILDNQQTWIIGFAFRPVSTLPVSDTIFCIISDSGTTQVDLRLTKDGEIKITRNGTSLETSALNTIVANVWSYIELKVYIHDTLGTYEIHVNGVDVLSGSGVDTQATSNAYANRIYLYNSQFAYTMYFDDFYICDSSGTTNNDFLGDCKVVANLSDGNGTNQNFTPSTGINHYAVIDETTPNDDTDYLYSSTVNHKDTNTFEDISITGSILGVQLLSYMRKDDAGSRTAAPVIRSGTTDYVGTSVYPGNSYTYYSQMYETDPNTSVAWTQSGVNNAEYGIKLVA